MASSRLSSRRCAGLVALGLILVLVPSTLTAQVIRVENVAGVPGEAGSLTIFAESSLEIAGLSFGVCFDSSLLTMAQIDPCATCVFDFFEPTTTAAGLGVGVVTSLNGSSSLLAGVEHPIAVISYVVSAAATGDIPVDVCVLTEATPPIMIVLSDPSGAEPPVQTVSGSVMLPAAASFVRGDFDADGAVAILDAIKILGWGFLGDPDPICLATIDVNGDGTLNPVLDAIVLLNYLFLGGSAPAAPFPDCGSDTLDCQATSNGCI